ncbi:hypothetical protein IAQ61_010682, partial [Plenodomus lingam]|uniref:uncharacterized protein n=1 Tax=Leptosphaeria maculans TaxID=5022 RepID=UPI00332AAFD7
ISITVASWEPCLKLNSAINLADSFCAREQYWRKMSIQRLYIYTEELRSSPCMPLLPFILPPRFRVACPATIFAGWKLGKQRSLLSSDATPTGCPASAASLWSNLLIAFPCFSMNPRL